MSDSATSEALRLPLVIVQVLACLAGGVWVGHSLAPGIGEFMGMGAFLFFGALFLAYFGGQKAAMMFGLALLGLRGAQRLGRWHALDDEAGRNRDRRDERRVDRVAAIMAALAFCGLATLVAFSLWIFAGEASLFGALLRGWAVSIVVAGLMPWTLPAIEDVNVGGTPPP